MRGEFEVEGRTIRLVTTPSLPDREIELRGIVYSSAIAGANLVRDMREAITNAIGGAMSRYESLFDRTIERALKQLAERAHEAGYDGVVDVRLSHPFIVSGAVEVVVMGTGFTYRQKPAG